jgi:hypothetical protein
MFRASIAVFVLVLALPVGAAATRAELARARTFYNQRQFDEAIAAADSARQTPETADAAAVVLARAHLERYRERVDPADLSAAREALAAVKPNGLDGRDRLELLVALGASLFLEDDFGAAAEIFASGLGRAEALDPALYDSLLDWWGSAVERQAAAADRDRRIAAFGRLSDRMNGELSRNPSSAVAGYWVVVAARGAGDPTRAWDAAVASWVRARLAGEHTAALRADLDRVVREGIIPDRVRDLPVDQRAQAESELRAQWELVKEKWK